MPEDLVVVYISCHGAPEIAAYDDITMRNLSIRLYSESPAEWAETIIRFPELPKTDFR